MPHNNIYIQVLYLSSQILNTETYYRKTNALLFQFDFETVTWFHKMVMEANAIIQSGLKDLGLDSEQRENLDHTDLRCDVVMPKVFLI